MSGQTCAAALGGERAQREEARSQECREGVRHGGATPEGERERGRAVADDEGAVTSVPRHDPHDSTLCPSSEIVNPDGVEQESPLCVSVEFLEQKPPTFIHRERAHAQLPP
jgi:hypothetical protein